MPLEFKVTEMSEIIFRFKSGANIAPCATLGDAAVTPRVCPSFADLACK